MSVKYRCNWIYKSIEFSKNGPYSVYQCSLTPLPKERSSMTTTLDTVKKSSSYRMSERSTELLDKLTGIYGLSAQGTLELLVRTCYRHEGKDLTDKTISRLVKNARDASSPMPAKALALSHEALELADQMGREHGISSRAEVLECCIMGAALVEDLI